MESLVSSLLLKFHFHSHFIKLCVFCNVSDFCSKLCLNLLLLCCLKVEMRSLHKICQHCDGTKHGMVYTGAASCHPLTLICFAVAWIRIFLLCEKKRKYLLCEDASSYIPGCYADHPGPKGLSFSPMRSKQIYWSSLFSLAKKKQKRTYWI